MTAQENMTLPFPEQEFRTPDWVWRMTSPPGMFRLITRRMDLIARSHQDGIPQVAPIVAAFREPPAAIRARIGKGLWKRVHHSELSHNILRARIKMLTKLDFATIMEIAPGALPEVVSLCKRRGEAALTIAARVAANRKEFRQAAMLADDTIRMGGSPSPNWSLRRLGEEHDRLAREIARRKASPKTFAAPWSMQVDGYTFTRLISPADFAEEGAVMRHCIASYASRAASGHEDAFRIEGPVRASVSFSWGGHMEIKGRMNSSVPAACRHAALKMHKAFLAGGHA